MSKIYLNYYEAKKEAEKLGLIEAEYGDLQEPVAYCYWNKTGDRNDEAEIEAYYMFGKDGKPYVWTERIWAEEFAKIVRLYTGIPISDMIF